MRPATRQAATRPDTAVSTRPTATRPIATRPAATRPIATRPAATRPVATRPVVTRPAATGPLRLPSDRPDILLITAANLPLHLTGFAGRNLVPTPNLDRLAAQGAAFTRFYIPTPLTAPSRATLLTGLYPHKHAVTADKIPLSPSADTFTARLAAAGYRCSLIGPWDLGELAETQPALGLTDYPAVTSRPWSWLNCDVWLDGQQTRTDRFLTDWTADQAVDELNRFHDKPLFLWVAFHAPGEPTAYPPGGENLYPPDALDLPATFTASPTNPPPVLGHSPAAQRLKQMNEQQLRQARSMFFAMTERLDEHVGRILDRIDALGLRDRTVVVFTSETGWTLGEHRLFAAAPAVYDEMIRCPLLIRAPGLSTPAARIDRVTAQPDLAPTLLEIARLEPPVTMQGRSLLTLLRNPRTDRWTDECFIQFDRIDTFACQARGLVVRNYKYLRYFAGHDALYDLKLDPDELHNAAQAPEYRAVVSVLRNRLNHWQRSARDPLYGKLPP